MSVLTVKTLELLYNYYVTINNSSLNVLYIYFQVIWILCKLFTTSTIIIQSILSVSRHHLITASPDPLLLNSIFKWPHTYLYIAFVILIHSVINVNRFTLYLTSILNIDTYMVVGSWWNNEFILYCLNCSIVFIHSFTDIISAFWRNSSLTAFVRLLVTPWIIKNDWITLALWPA